MRITDAGLEYLESLSSLEMLLLDGTEVSDAGMPHLTHLSHLKQVELGRTGVTPNGVKLLKTAFPNLNVSL